MVKAGKTGELKPGNPRSLVLILRDREDCGGGIHTYFEAIDPHLVTHHEFCDVGRPHACYGGRSAGGSISVAWRVVLDWIVFAMRIVRVRPSLVHLNTGLDKEERSLKRDAINILIACALGCPVLVSWHGWDHPAKGTADFPGGNDGWLCRIYKKAAGHVVLASRFKADLQRWGFRDPIHVATTAVPSKVLDAGAAGERGEPSGRKLLFLSRIEREKGLWELIDAYAILRQRNSSYQLVIAGGGPDLDPLKRRVSDLRLDDVTFPGFVSGELKLQCFRDASVFCLLSYSEGMPLAVLEALAMRLPLVSSAVGGLHDILEDGKNGFFVDLRDPDSEGRRFDPTEVADRIEQVFNNPGLEARISATNADYARSHFSPEKVAGRLEGVYRDLCGVAKSHDEGVAAR